MIARILDALRPPYTIPSVGQVLTWALIAFLWHGWYASIGERDRLYELAVRSTGAFEECKVETGAQLDSVQARLELFRAAYQRVLIQPQEIQP